jgi:hypothetical protein
VSLLRAAIRACAVAALRDKTWAGSRVYDSDLRPFASAVLGQEAPQPYAVVYTDADDQSPVVNGKQMLSGQNRSLSLVVEIGSANAIRKTGDGPTTIVFALTDEGQELAVDALDMQVTWALFNDPTSMWGQMFQRFWIDVRRAPSRRGGQNQQGVRFAARRLTYILQPIWDFTPNQKPVPTHAVWDFINLANQYPASGCKDVSDAIQFLMAVQDAPDWRIAQAQLGMFTKAAKMLNLPGTPLPWGQVTGEVPVEEPPYDATDHGEAALGTIPSDEYVPVLNEVNLADDIPPTWPDPVVWPDVFYYD